jgi:F0F1-type ATP synthase assembly protein I
MTGNPVGTPRGPVDPRRVPEEGISAGEYAGFGIQFAASIVVFLYVGQWLDRKLGTAPWLLLVGVFLGAGGSFYSMYRKLMAAQAREDAARAERRKDGQP